MTMLFAIIIRFDSLREITGSLLIIGSTTISLFSNLFFKDVGRHSKAGKKKGGIKVHTMIHANEGVPSAIQFTSVATHDAFMLKPDALKRGDIIAMDRAYIDYAKFEGMTSEGIVYVTKMKKNLRCTVESDIFYQTSDGVSEIEVKHIVFTKQVKKTPSSTAPASSSMLTSRKT